MENPLSKHLSMQFEWMLEWVNIPLNALDDDDFKESAIEGGNTGIWILGHLIVSDDDFALFTGKGELLYPEYVELFGPGTKPKSAENYPSVSELREAWDKVCEKNRKIYEELTDEELKLSHALINEEGKNFVKTIGEVATTWQMHQVYHAGQLSQLVSRIKKQKTEQTV